MPQYGRPNTGRTRRRGNKTMIPGERTALVAEPRPLVSLVICTLNEADSIAGVLAEAAAVLDGLAYEIVVVDDSADDATARAVLACAAQDDRVRLVRRAGVRGLASACIAGWDASRGELLAVMDGDGQHETGKLREMIELLAASDADLAVASRFRDDTTTGLTGPRHVLSCLGSSLIHAVLGARTTDPLAGFFVQRRAWFEHVRPRLCGVGFKILVDVLASGRRAPKVVEVSTKLRARVGGASKLDLRIIVELAAQIVDKRTGGVVPARFCMFAGVGAVGVAVHLATLSAMELADRAPFWLAQGTAIAVAMSSNYLLNNLLTFRDLRLRGAAFWRGWLAFALACSSGALISEILGAGLSRSGVHWLAAGAIGAMAAAVWNYWSASRAAWGVRASRRDAALGDPARSSAAAGVRPAFN